MLKETFIEFLTNFTGDKSLIINLWKEIENNYSNKKRHYHTLSHLDNLLKQLLEVKEKIESWETILFTLYYHDIIYDALKSDNEEQSAKLAEKRMKQINVPIQIIENCTSQILATKKHLDNSNSDTNYFLDADLTVLGMREDRYKEYSKSVRLEYLFYPSVIYNKGRIQLLNNLLKQEYLFKTEYFKNLYDKQARINITKEIESLENCKHEVFSIHSKQWCYTVENDGDWYEFFHEGAELLKSTNGVEITNYYPGFFDSGYCRFNFKNVKLNLEYEGMLGVALKTEPYPSEYDLKIAKEIYEILKLVRNTNYA